MYLVSVTVDASARYGKHVMRLHLAYVPKPASLSRLGLVELPLRGRDLRVAQPAPGPQRVEKCRDGFGHGEHLSRPREGGDPHDEKPRRYLQDGP